MTVHMFRVYVDPGSMGGEKLVQTVNDWMEQYTKWADDPTDHTIAPTVDIETGEKTHYVGNVRFMKVDAKDNILQKLTDKLKNKVKWYRVGYHNCGNDREDLSVEYDCQWDASVEFGQVLDDIPGFK